MLFKKRIPTPVRSIGTIDTPNGAAIVDEWSDHLRLIFDDDKGYCFFLRAEGDLLRISFNLGTMCLEEHLTYALWILNSAEVAEMVNSKFGNKLELRFSAAIYATTDRDKRSCVLLPSDTSKTAAQRLEGVWFKQAPIMGYCGKLATCVE